MLRDGKQIFANFIADSVTVLYLIRYDSLLQNTTDIILKYDSYFITNATQVYYKLLEALLQNAAVLLQNATVIT